MTKGAVLVLAVNKTEQVYKKRSGQGKGNKLRSLLLDKMFHPCQIAGSINRSLDCGFTHDAVTPSHY